MAHWMLGSYLKFWFKGLIRKSPMLEPIEGKGQQILERTFRRRSGTFPRADHCRLKKGLSEPINKICHDPFIVFIQFRLQIHQMAGCLFVITLLHRNRACSPHSPESLFGKTGTLSQSQGLLTSPQSLVTLTGIVLVNRADQQHLAGSARVIILKIFGRAQKVINDVEGARNFLLTETHPNRM